MGLESLRRWDANFWRVAPVTTVSLSEFAIGRYDPEATIDKETMLRALAAKPEFAHLCTLDLMESGATAADLEILFDSPYLKRLRALYLGFNGLRDEIGRVLACVADLPALTTLSLDGNQLREQEVAVLAASLLLGRLTNLGLATNSLGNSGAERLASLPQVSNLEYLSVYENGITDRGALALAGSPYLGRLKGLWLMVNDIGPEGQGALRERFGNRVYFG